MEYIKERIKSSWDWKKLCNLILLYDDCKSDTPRLLFKTFSLKMIWEVGWQILNGHQMRILLFEIFVCIILKIFSVEFSPTYLREIDWIIRIRIGEIILTFEQDEIAFFYLRFSWQFPAKSYNESQRAAIFYNLRLKNC